MKDRDYTEESVQQLSNGKWVWFDETWCQYEVEYDSKEEATWAQAQYCKANGLT